MANDFAGKNGFYWWKGTIEDRMDPLFCGRCRVRILGVHTDSKSKSSIPTSDLPWAQIIIPVNQEERIVPPKEGTWVFGFYGDGEECQEPIIFGVIPGIPEEPNPNINKEPDSQNGFFDPAGVRATDDLLETRPLNIESGFILSPADNSSTSIRNVKAEEELKSKNVYPKRIGEPDTHRLARDEKEFDPRSSQQLKWKIDNAISYVDTSISGYSWREPNPITIYNAIYPFNKVMESESGHIQEIDDTVNFERLHEFHRSGSYYEIQANGTKTEKTVGDNIAINHLDRKEYTINSEWKKVGGSSYTLVQGDMNQICRGSNYYAIWSNPTIYISCSGGSINIKSNAMVNIDAPRVNINCGVAQDPPSPNTHP